MYRPRKRKSQKRDSHTPHSTSDFYEAIQKLREAHNTNWRYSEGYYEEQMAQRKVIPEEKQEEKTPVMKTLTAAALRAGLRARIIGQNDAIENLIPYVVSHSAGLSNEGRPAGSFLLLGPTGTGKTRTAEALGEVLHGDDKKFLRIDCGQLALSHEVAKLLGAPPGYLGHRETTPLITNQKLKEITSETCPISIVIFDEIEKAHVTLYQTLLSIMDKGVLSLGDGTTVNFVNTLVFFTSNLGAREMQNTLTPELGFAPSADHDGSMTRKMERISTVAVRKKFSPEFVNRLDEIITYAPLTREAIETIFTLTVDKLRANIFRRFADKSFMLVFSEGASEYLIREGFSERYGARELARVIFRCVTNPLGNFLTERGIAPGSVVKVYLNKDGKIALDVLDEAALGKALQK